jgi:hypothetical protein
MNKKGLIRMRMTTAKYLYSIPPSLVFQKHIEFVESKRCAVGQERGERATTSDILRMAVDALQRNPEAEDKRGIPTKAPRLPVFQVTVEQKQFLVNYSLQKDCTMAQTMRNAITALEQEDNVK